jgi:two-component system phosphate regulon sensor histidine kinase PhoR
VNLLDNAIKYSDEGSTVWVESTQADGEIIISVRDQGRGIAKEHLPRVFERFYRVDKARSRALGGTGLGLAIVKHITEAHGGHVDVKSLLGKGSTFSLHLPAIASGD